MTRTTTARSGALIGLAVAGALTGSVGTASAQYYVYEDEAYAAPAYPRRGYIYGYDYDFYAPRPPAAIPQRSAGRIAAREYGFVEIERSLRRGGSWVIDGRRGDGSRARVILDASSGDVLDIVPLGRARPQAPSAPHVARTEPEAVPAPRIAPRAAPAPAPARPRASTAPVPPDRPAALKPPAQASAPARATPPSPASPQRSAPAATAPAVPAQPDGASGPDGRPVRVIPMGPTQPAAPEPAQARAPAGDVPAPAMRPSASDKPRLVDPNDIRPADEPERTPPLARALDLPPPAVMPPVQLDKSETAPTSSD